MQPLGPRTFFEEDLDTRGCARSNTLSRNKLGFVQVKELSRGECRSEMRHDAGCMEACVMEAALYRGADPNRGLDAYRISGKNIVPGRIQLLTNGERSRQSHHTGMHDACRVGVVVIETVHEQTVGKGSIAWSEAALVSDQRALARSSDRSDSGQRGCCVVLGV